MRFAIEAGQTEDRSCVRLARLSLNRSYQKSSMVSVRALP